MTLPRVVGQCNESYWNGSIWVDTPLNTACLLPYPLPTLPDTEVSPISRFCLYLAWNVLKKCLDLHLPHFNTLRSVEFNAIFGYDSNDIFVGVMKMGNIVPRMAVEPTSMALRASVLPLHHVGSLMSPLYPLYLSFLPQRSMQTTTMVYGPK